MRAGVGVSRGRRLEDLCLRKYRDVSKRSPTDKGLGKGLATFIGISELAGAIGVVVPWATHIVPQLTPIAAAALALVMLMALGYHIQGKEPPAKSAPSLILLLLSLFVAYGRGMTAFA